MGRAPPFSLKNRKRIMAKIKSINPQVKGIQLQVPIDGLISVDANGFAVVSDKCAELLIKGTSDWKSADSEHDADDNSEEQDFITKVKKMTLDEMVKLCEELGFDQNEYKKLLGKKTSEKLLAGYLIKKYSELEAAAEEGEDAEDVDDQNGSEAEDSEDKDAEETADETETDDDEDAEHDADDAEEQAEDKSKGKGKKSAAKGKK